MSDDDAPVVVGGEDVSHLLNRIDRPVVCAQCADEFATGGTDAASLRDYVRFDVGFTDEGLQVWCRRHEANVVHVRFEGTAPPADFRSLKPKGG